jgi:hypothetical protein
MELRRGAGHLVESGGNYGGNYAPPAPNVPMNMGY